jgi:hypothetical protein
MALERNSGLDLISASQTPQLPKLVEQPNSGVGGAVVHFGGAPLFQLQKYQKCA